MSRMRRNDKEQAKIGRKGKPLEGWTGGQSANDWGWKREGRMQADPRRRDASQGM